MKELLLKMHDWMDGYMRQFVTDDKEVMQGINIKTVHTGFVTKIAVELARHLKLNEHDTALAEIMGLLHDVGRFRQYSLYKTFNDAKSEDHADLGLKVLAEEMPYMSELNKEDAELICFAIKNHNKKEIAKTTDKRKLFFAKLLRDADKLDIYRVLTPFLTPDGADKAPKFVKSNASQLVSPDFVAAFARGEQADYRNLRTHGDRKIVRLMWVYDINFSWTLRKIVERGYIDLIIKYLPQQEGLDIGIARLRQYVQKKCAMQDNLELG